MNKNEDHPGNEDMIEVKVMNIKADEKTENVDMNVRAEIKDKSDITKDKEESEKRKSYRHSKTRLRATWRR